MIMGGVIILARLLEPEDFGVFGIGLLFVGLGTRFGDIGFSQAFDSERRNWRGPYFFPFLL